VSLPFSWGQVPVSILPIFGLSASDRILFYVQNHPYCAPFFFSSWPAAIFFSQFFWAYGGFFLRAWRPNGPRKIGPFFFPAPLHRPLGWTGFFFFFPASRTGVHSFPLYHVRLPRFFFSWSPSFSYVKDGTFLLSLFPCSAAVPLFSFFSEEGFPPLFTRGFWTSLTDHRPLFFFRDGQGHARLGVLPGLRHVLRLFSLFSHDSDSRRVRHHSCSPFFPLPLGYERKDAFLVFPSFSFGLFSSKATTPPFLSFSLHISFSFRRSA